MAGAAGVFRVEEDATATVFLEAARSDFGVERVWIDTGFTGAGIDICVVDSGVEATHEQFVDEATNANKVVAFKDFVGDVYGVFQTESYDDVGHGTHVAATVAGDGTGSALGARGPVVVAAIIPRQRVRLWLHPDSRILVLRGVLPTETGGGTSAR